MTDQTAPDGFAEVPREADTDAFIRDLAAELRLAEDVTSGFEARVMASVRNEARARRATSRPWWRQRSIHLTPVGALALAAGLAAIAYVGARAVEGERSADVTGSAAVAAQDVTEGTAELVRFVFVDPGARQVAVVGSFNQWRKDATPLHATGVPGVWAVSIPLEAGRHEYAFVVDGEKWSPDPFAPGITDEFGTESSVVRIGQPSTSS